MVSIDIPSGQIKTNIKVTGYNTWGEMTRIFAYDNRRNLFYMIEANFTGPDPPPGQDPQRMVTFYSVDPTTGVATGKLLRGIYNFPTGFAYSCATDSIIVAVQRYAINGTINGYLFYKIDPNTVIATFVSNTSVRRGWLFADKNIYYFLPVALAGGRQ